jgi:hypothetical protein
VLGPMYKFSATMVVQRCTSSARLPTLLIFMRPRRRRTFPSSSLLLLRIQRKVRRLFWLRQLLPYSNIHLIAEHSIPTNRILFCYYIFVPHVDSYNAIIITFVINHPYSYPYPPHLQAMLPSHLPWQQA